MISLVSIGRQRLSRRISIQRSPRISISDVCFSSFFPSSSLLSNHVFGHYQFLSLGRFDHFLTGTSILTCPAAQALPLGATSRSCETLLTLFILGDSASCCIHHNTPRPRPWLLFAASSFHDISFPFSGPMPHKVVLKAHHISTMARCLPAN